MRRRSMSRRASRRSFSRSASMTHRKNMMSSGGRYVMRGGLRI